MSSLNQRDQEISILWAWETRVEQRKTAAAAMRLSTIYFTSESTIWRIARNENSSPFVVDSKALTSGIVYEQKIFQVIRETYMGGHEDFHVVVLDQRIYSTRTLGDAKAFVGNMIKLINARLGLLQFYDT